MSRYRDAVAFVGLGLMWGLSFPSLEVALDSIPPLLMAAFRFDLSGLILLAYVVAVADEWRPGTRSDLAAIASGGALFIAVGNGVWFVGQQLTTSALSGLMTSLIPILTAAISWHLLPRDRLRPLGVVGLGVGFAGALMILLPETSNLLAPGVVGKVYMVVGAVGTALGSVLVRRSEPRISSSATTAWSMLFGAALLHAISPVAGEAGAGALDVTVEALLALLYLSVVSSAFAYVVYFNLLDRRSAIELSLVTYLVPVVAVVAGWLLFGEQVGPRVIAGFLVIVVGFGLMKREALRTEVVRLRGGV